MKNIILYNLLIQFGLDYRRRCRLAQPVDVALASGRTVRDLALDGLLVAEPTVQVHGLLLALNLQRGHIDGNYISQLWESARTNLVKCVALVLETHPSILLALVGIAVGDRATLRQDEVLGGLARTPRVDEVAGVRVRVVDVP